MTTGTVATMRRTRCGMWSRPSRGRWRNGICGECVLTSRPRREPILETNSCKFLLLNCDRYRSSAEIGPATGIKCLGYETIFATLEIYFEISLLVTRYALDHVAIVWRDYRDRCWQRKLLRGQVRSRVSRSEHKCCSFHSGMWRVCVTKLERHQGRNKQPNGESDVSHKIGVSVETSAID